MLGFTIQEKKQSEAAQNAFASWSDLALVEWVADKQTDWPVAFSVLASRYRPWVFKRCLFRLANFHDAEDAAQDIVMKVYANLHQLKGRAQFRAWLRTVVDNYCNTFAVRRARYTTCDHFEQLIELHELYAFSIPHDVLAEKELVQRALSSLPENAQQVLRLRFYADHSLEEIANILCLTLSAAKARLYRAIEQFKVQYCKLDGEHLSSVTGAR